MKSATAMVLVVCLSACQHRIQQNLPTALTEGAVIEELRHVGNNSISSDVIRASIQTKAGERLSVATFRRDIQKLYSLGYFDAVTVDESSGANGGKVLTFMVKEKPRQ